MQLGVPALVGLTVLSPLIWLTVATSRSAGYGWPLLPFEWHHMWFLFGLILYSCIAVVLHAADTRHALMARLDRLADAHSGRVAVLIAATASAALLGAALPLLRWLLPPSYLHGFGNAQLIAGYLPMFVLGFVLARADRLRGRVVEARGLGLAICFGATAAYAAAHLLTPLAHLAAYVRFVAAALCPPAAFLLILRSALTIRRVPALVGHFSEASYTIYILHYPLSVLINTHFATGVEPHLAYILSILASGAASFAFHVLAVQSSPPLALLLNGKFERRAPQPAAPVPDLPVSEDARIATLPAPLPAID